MVTDVTALNELRGHPNVRAPSWMRRPLRSRAAIDELLDAPRIPRHS